MTDFSEDSFGYTAYLYISFLFAFFREHHLVPLVIKQLHLKNVSRFVLVGQPRKAEFEEGAACPWILQKWIPLREMRWNKYVSFF